jgi:hypothetical protein
VQAKVSNKLREALNKCSLSVLLENRDDHKARDAGRSWDYDAKERNAMSARFYRNPGDGALRAACLVRLLAKRVNHSRRRLSRIPSRKAAVAPA